MFTKLFCAYVFCEWWKADLPLNKLGCFVLHLGVLCYTLEKLFELCTLERLLVHIGEKLFEPDTLEKSLVHT